MNEDRAEGSLKQAIGKVMGNIAIQAESAARTSAGEVVQRAVGTASDKACTASDDNECSGFLR